MAGLIVVWAAWALFGPRGNGIPVGPETTFLDGPIDAAGYVDYGEAVREAGRVTPEDNAAVPLFRVTQAELRRSIPAPQYVMACEDLNVPTQPDPAVQLPRISNVPPPEGWDDTEVDGRTRTWRDVVDELWERPWTEADHPHVAAYLRGGETAVGVLADGLDRPGFWFFPDYGGRLYEHLLPMIQESREVARFLLARAMLRLGEGDFEGAAADIDLTRKLGRAIAQSPFLISGLVGIAIDAMAGAAEIELLYAADGAAFLRRRLAALHAYDADLHRRRMAVSLDRFERLSALEIVQTVDRVRRGLEPPTVFNSIGITLTGLPWTLERMALRRVDLADASRRINGYMDSAITATDEPSAEAAGEAAGSLDVEPPGEGVFAQLDADYVNDRLVSLLLPAVRQAAVAAFRAKTKRELLRVLAAGRLFEIETGRPPTSPENLVPKYLPEWPTDHQDGRPLKHRTRDGVWSVYGSDPTHTRPAPNDLPPYLLIEFPRQPRDEP